MKYVVLRPMLKEQERTCRSSGMRAGGDVAFARGRIGRSTARHNPAFCAPSSSKSLKLATVRGKAAFSQMSTKTSRLQLSHRLCRENCHWTVLRFFSTGQAPIVGSRSETLIFAGRGSHLDKLALCSQRQRNRAFARCAQRAVHVRPLLIIHSLAIRGPPITGTAARTSRCCPQRRSVPIH